jgi:hypothetical protein
MKTPTILSATDQFLNYLNPLDIKMLDIILDDDSAYFGTTKAIFFERLKYIFDQHKLSHDVKAPEIKQHKKYSNVFKLKLHALSETIKFIIDEKNGRIHQIYNNRMISTSEESDMISPYDMVFGDDEKPGFTPSSEYLLNLYDCGKAIQELETSQPKLFISRDLIKWTKKHKLLFDYTTIHFKYYKFKPFRDMYLSINHILKYLAHTNKVLEALNSIDESNNESINSWLNKFDRLAFCEVLSFGYMFYEIDFEKKVIQHERNSNIFLIGEDFFALIRFNRLFLHYNEIIMNT